MKQTPVVYVEMFGVIGTTTKVVEGDEYGNFGGWVTVWKKGEKVASYRTESVKAVWKGYETSLIDDGIEEAEE